MKRLLSYFLVWFVLILSAQDGRAQAPSQAYESYFPLLAFSQLHLCMSKMVWPACKVGTQFSFLPAAERNKHFHCIGFFKIDMAGRYRGYLVAEQARNEIFLYVVDKSRKETILGVEVASYTYLMGAMKSVTNCWIMDCDRDMNMDILIHTELEDFEFPTADAPNLSGSKYHRYSLVDGKMEYLVWPDGLELGVMCD